MSELGWRQKKLSVNVISKFMLQTLKIVLCEGNTLKYHISLYRFVFSYLHFHFQMYLWAHIKLLRNISYESPDFHIKNLYYIFYYEWMQMRLLRAPVSEIDKRHFLSADILDRAYTLFIIIRIPCTWIPYTLCTCTSCTSCTRAQIPRVTFTNVPSYSTCTCTVTLYMYCMREHL